MFDYIDKNITQINEAFTSGSLTSHDFVLSLLQRISEIDNGEVKYNSILEVNPNALNEALVLDEERKNGHIRSSIHGIPVILKDNINTKGAMHTTAGSITLKDNFATEDAFIVKTLKEKGAIILAKANLTEFANFMSYNMRNGYSSLGKEVLCPHNIDKDPSGSSAGSAVSVSLNLAPFSIGSETGGSIMSPSMQNGVVGLKPTIGHISRDGIIPISSTLDTAGPIAKNVTDIAYALTNLKAKDPNDPVTLIKDDSYKDYTEYLDIDGLKKLRIGINRDNFDKLPQLRKDAFLNVLNILEESGAILIDNITLNQPEKIFHIMKYEFKRNINKYLSTTPKKVKVKTLADIIKLNKEYEDTALKYGQQLLVDSNDVTGRLIEPEYIAALQERAQLQKETKDVIKQHNLDVIYFATYTSLGPECGFPSMTIPIGRDEDNIPIGSYFLADHNKEENLIKALFALEQKLNLNMNPLKK